MVLPAVANELTAEGRALIYEFECSGETGYKRHPYPEWPKGQSGITWGVGYDATAQSAALIRRDWQALGEQDAGRLAATHPYRGLAARDHLPDVRDILVVWEVARDVFEDVDLARNVASCRRAFPGFDGLKPNARAAMISLVFNRGTSTVGETRREMKALRDSAIPRADYREMARLERASEWVWRGTENERGMTRRREAEARLIETCL